MEQRAFFSNVHEILSMRSLGEGTPLYINKRENKEFASFIIQRSRNMQRKEKFST